MGVVYVRELNTIILNSRSLDVIKDGLSLLLKGINNFYERPISWKYNLAHGYERVIPNSWNEYFIEKCLFFEDNNGNLEFVLI